jgi:hypothetical protein
MLSVPVLAGPALELVSDGGTPVKVSPELAPGVPETPAARAELAIALALETAFGAFTVARRQRGIDPVMVVATADSTAGRSMIDKRYGAGVAEALCGPMVFALAEAEVAQLLGPAAAAGIARVYQALKRAPGEPRFLLAVNGNLLDARVMRDVVAPAVVPAEPVVPAPAPEAAPAATVDLAGDLDAARASMAALLPAESPVVAAEPQAPESTPPVPSPPAATVEELVEPVAAALVAPTEPAPAPEPAPTEPVAPATA